MATIAIIGEYGLPFIVIRDGLSNPKGLLVANRA